jgi:glycosyltransferase involved in cell wall biosynthesis
MRTLQAERQDALSRFFGGVDRVVAVSGWLRDMLVANGVAREKITLCRHGCSQSESIRSRREARSDKVVLKLAFLGRLNPAKGIHILIEALRRRPHLRLQLDVFGIVQDHSDYVDDLKKRTDRDPRIRLLDPVPNEEVVGTLQNYDMLAVPSQWMETGPLVVYDAFLAGIPVLGSRRGGLVELITHERDGLLVEPGDPEAWACTLERLCADQPLQERLRSGVRPPRSMSTVATEMSELYGRVIDGPSRKIH